MDSALNKINAYILIGGQSKRFGEPKCLVNFNGKSLTENVYRNIIPTFNNVNIIGKENHFPDYNFVKDMHSIQCPMNGISTALEHSETEWIFVMGCDLPLIKPYIINHLYGNIDKNVQAVIPFVNDRLQPLCAFYHKNILNDFTIAIGQGDYSLMKILKQIAIKKITIPLEAKEQFLNINYPEDLNRAEELVNSR